jgi:phenylacetate-CoA ligase
MQREVITEVFGAPVQETYGMAELAVAASECQAGRRHVWPEVGLVETVEEELVATGLLNQDMPLVRYRTGDRLARVPKWDHGCPCGRTLPVIDAVDGRIDDVVVTPDGRRLGRLDPVFKSDLAIVEAQIVQDRIDHLRILVVPAEGFDHSAAKALERRVLDHVGAMVVDVELTDRIPRGPGGKLRGVRNLIDGSRT